MKLAVMTQPQFFVEEDKILSSLIDVGLDTLHLRKPDAEPAYLERLLTLLHEDCFDKIVAHDHYYMKSEYGLRGIHLDGALTPAPSGYKGHVGRTCHTLDELKEAKRRSDYVFLANTFGQGAAFSDEELEQAAWRGLIDKKVYAVGGINIDTLHHARELGFGGAVVCGDLWSRFDIHAQLDYKGLIAHFDRLRKAAGG